MGNSVSVRVGAPGAKQASSDVDTLRDKFRQLQEQGGKGFAIGAGAAVTAKALNLVGGAANDVVGFLNDSVTAYREQEVASGRLDASLKANVTNLSGAKDAIKQVTDAGVNLGFTDTDITNSMSLLVGATHDVAQAQKVLAVAEDLSRFKGISLMDAASALTSIEAGRSRGLAQLGINVKDFATTEERLAAVEKVAGGQAQQYANSDLGAVDKATAKVDEAQEKFGKGLSKLEAVILPAVGDAIGGLADQVGALTDMFDENVAPADKLRGEAEAIRSGILASIPGAKQYADLLDHQADSLDAAANATHTDRLETDAWNDSVTSATIHAKDAAGAAVALGAAALGAASGTIGATQAAKTYNDWLAQLARTSYTLALPAISDLDQQLDELFSGTKRKGQKAGLFNELHTLQDQLATTNHEAAKVKDEIAVLEDRLKKPTTSSHEAKVIADDIVLLQDKLAKLKDKGDAEVIAGQIADVRTSIIKLNIEAAAQSGDKGKLTKLLQHYEGEFKNTDAGAYKLIQRLEQLYGLPSKYPIGVTVREIGGTGGTGKVVGAFAEGGIVKAKPGGSIVKVAEAGHDEAIVPLSGPYAPKVDPLPALVAGGASMSVTVNVNLPNAYGMTPGQADSVGRTLAPIIAREMQRQRLIPRSV